MAHGMGQMGRVVGGVNERGEENSETSYFSIINQIISVFFPLRDVCILGSFLKL